MQWNFKELSATATVCAALAVAVQQNITCRENDILKLFHFTFPFYVSTKKINRLSHTSWSDVCENLNQRKIV